MVEMGTRQPGFYVAVQIFNVNIPTCVYFLFIMCVHVYLCACVCVHEEVRGQLSGFSFLLLPCGGGGVPGFVAVSCNPVYHSGFFRGEELTE